MIGKAKRKKCKDNPYTIIYCEKENKFKVKFKDAEGIIQIVDITEEQAYEFNDFELDDKSQLNKTERHIEYSEIYEETLHTRVKDKPLELDEEIIQKITYEYLHIAIKQLPDIQQRRIQKYFFEEKTFEEIANLENCTKVAIKYSIDTAIKNLKKFLENNNKF